MMLKGPEAYQSKFHARKEETKNIEAADSKKTSTACTNCRKRHIKCIQNGNKQCVNCAKFKKICVYKEADKKVNVTVDQLESLQDDILRLTEENNRLKMSLKDLVEGNGTSRTVEFGKANKGRLSSERSPESMSEGDLKEPILSPSNQAYPYLTSSGHILNTDNISRHSQCFPSKSLLDIDLKKLIKHFKNGNAEFETHGAFNNYLHHSSLDLLKVGRNNLHFTFYHSFELKEKSIEVVFPDYETADLYLKRLLVFNSGCLYFFNEGLLSENLTRIYNEKHLIPEFVYSKKGLKQNSLTISLMISKMLLIFAFGDFLKNTETELSGNVYFSKATEILSLVLGNNEFQNCAEEGGIEVLLLLSNFLQLLDQTTSSSLVLGTAINCLTILGVQVDNGTKELSRCELEHRRRLFWTAYTMERLLATSTGLPLTIHDNSITLELPHNLTHSEKQQYYSFSDAEFARQYILISKLGAEVLKKLYTNKPKKSILPIVHELTVKLLRWKKGLPDHIRFEYNDTVVRIPRHLTLLMAEYFQGLNLAVRHLLFHFTSLQLSSNDKKYMDLSEGSYIISALLNASFQASMNTIRSFHWLFEHNELAFLGYMEREYIYTATVNLVLFNISFGVYQATNIHIDHALGMLVQMHKVGNKSATLRIIQVLILIKNMDFGESMTSILDKYSDFDGSKSKRLFYEVEEASFPPSKRQVPAGYNTLIDSTSPKFEPLVAHQESFNRQKSVGYSESPQFTDLHQADMGQRNNLFSPALVPQLTSLEELLSDFVSLSSTSGPRDIDDLWDEEIFAWN